ncbi:LysR family transcriptional regulator [Trinickia caryophylli]|uniref:Transcriptional regulator, LysR family n=1 Tax=Trinickia caryophylli TaxID=28094 RepID=A0A1X7CQ12_TRICW|nr:LysR family transcriptional regulator [Trinickia caryophylli]PMS11309.1 LysR family transcriptional regulator [Trinickia caryophylli]TRX16789.1 LysR family transcriptional regulator [Trinickia caryophylli]WQE12486.1 LysR family transcriptional regulator [Trinickia caryophylli]SMF00441.1 transcriptional regulator, LysR family [Trinickia caryophylli]GLU30167.1 LysR family transcriptional regulator [Trinickia caryophylli]
MLDAHNLNDLMYFAQVVEHGGFSAAERVLGISKSRLSRRVAELETSLGVRLLQRSTRKLALTEAGQRFYTHCQAMLSEAQAAMNAVQELRAAPRGTVRVSVPVTVSQTMLSNVLPEFLLRYPEVRVSVRVTNRVIDLYEDSIDVALRVRSEPPDSANVVARPLWRTEQMLVGAPNLLSQHAPPLVPADLARFQTLDTPSGDGRHVFHLIAPDGQRYLHEHEPRVVTADLGTIREAVMAGVGIAALPVMMYGAAMRAGQLSPVMPGWTLPAPQLFAVFVSRQGLAPAVRAFVDYLVEVLDGGGQTSIECPTHQQVVALQQRVQAVPAASSESAEPVGHDA